MNCLLTELLKRPEYITTLDPGQLTQLISQGRSSKLLGTLGLALENQGLLERIAPNIRRHLVSAMQVHTKQKHDLTYEIKWLRQALDTTGEKLVLLKGAAYLQAGLPLSAGRMLSDIDLLTPAKHIQAVEKALNNFGWLSEDMSPYDERYYRRWMHEVPPLGHKARASTIDLHHTILPPTAGLEVNADLLFEELVEIGPSVWALSPRDMVIHSATHLFHEGEFHNGLRDLWDLHCMLRDFPATDPSFWQNLVPRARQLNLLGSLFHSLRYTELVFGSEIPTDIRYQVSSVARKLRSPLMDFLFLRVFRPDQPECRLPMTSLAENLLYLRSHYLRMPLYLLIPHLLRKSWMKRFKENDDEEERTKE